MLITYSSPPLDIAVSDRVFQGTVIKQLARPGKLEIQDQADGSCVVHQWVVLTAYANVDGGYGEPLPADVVAPRRIPLIADNNAAVDAAPDTAGRLRYVLVTEAVAPNPVLPAGAPGQVRDALTNEVLTLPAGQGWRDFLDAHPEPLLLQGFAFAAMQDQQDVRIRDLKEHHIRQADAMGKFA